MVISVRGYVLSWDLEVEEHVAIRPDGSYIPIPKIGKDSFGKPNYMATITYVEHEEGCRATGSLRGVFKEICLFDERVVSEMVAQAAEESGITDAE